MKRKIVPIAIAGIIALALAWSIFDSLTGSINPSFSWSLLAQGILLIVIVVGGWSALRKGNPTGARMTFYAFATVFTIGGALAFIYGPAKTKTMVTEITRDYVEKTAFDLRSGEPLTMGYLNLNGKWQNAYDPETGEILTPADCRPKGSHHFDKAGNVFPYAEQGTCFSPVAGGVRLTPISTETLKSLEKVPKESAPKIVLQKKSLTATSDKPASDIQVPGCENGWATFSIPKGWYVETPWNVNFKIVEFRNTETGDWENQNELQGKSYDSGRICATKESYKNNFAQLSWRKI